MTSSVIELRIRSKTVTVSCYEASTYLEDMIEFKVFINENLFWWHKNSLDVSMAEEIKEEDTTSPDVDELCRKFEKLEI